VLPDGEAGRSLIEKIENGLQLNEHHVGDGSDRMNAILGRLLAGVAFMTAANCAVAQEIGDAREGFAYAGQVCAECHAVRAGEFKSPHAQVPSFQTVANTSGMTPTALRVWFQSAHRSMPNLILSEQDSDNIIAYILSLKKRS
jgi:mono/diheme cytochrome c family protein